MLSRREFTVSVLGAAVAQVAGAAPFQTDGRPGSRTAPAVNADALAGLTLAEAATRLRSGAVTSVDLVNACLSRVDVYNPKINAFITVTREQALARAKALDAEQRAGKVRGPLHGVP